jgi:hypothetical protein
MQRFYSSLFITAMIWAIFNLSHTSETSRLANQRFNNNTSDLILLKPASELHHFRISRRNKQQYWLIFPEKFR